MLKEIRKKQKITQKELSKLSNVPLRTLQGYEQGEKNIDNAKIDTLAKISIALNCRISELINNKKIKENLKHAKL